MDDGVEVPESTGRRGTWAVRIAGALLLALGVANLALGGVAALTTAIRLPDSTAAGLAMLGLLTAVLGTFVLRGHRWALVVALLVFGILFLLQAFLSSGGTTTPALLTLAVILVPVVLALRADRAQR